MDFRGPPLANRTVSAEKWRLERIVVFLQVTLSVVYAVCAYTGVFRVQEPVRTPAVVYILGYHAFFVWYALVFCRNRRTIVWVDLSLAPLEIACITVAWLGEASRESMIWITYIYALFAYSRHIYGRRYVFTAGLIITCLVGGTLALDVAADRGWFNDRTVALIVITVAMAVLASGMSRAWRHAEERALDLARTDPLTGIANRRTFFNDLNTATAGDAGYAVLMFDLDNFKRLNDEQGHIEGDRALAEVANILSTHRRTGDFVARYGGEEFVMFLDGASDGRGALVGERLRAAIEASTPVTVSIGCAVRRGSERFDDVIRRADDLLRLAKRGGKNRVYTESHEAQAA